MFVADGPRGGRCVVDAGDAARRAGVRTGTPAADAEARLGRRLHVADYDVEAERRALTELAGRLERFSPLVGLAAEEPRPESLLLDLTGVPPLFGGMAPLLSRLDETFRAERLSVRLAVASTRGAAWGLARFDPRAAERPLEIPPTETTAALSPLPVAALRLPEATLALLAEFALETIGDLLALPRESLTVRCGDELSRRLDQVLGLAADPWRPILASPQPRADWNLEAPLTDADSLRALLDVLCRRLAEALAAEALGALAVEYTIRLDDGDACTGVLRFHRPASEAERLLELWLLQLERRRLAAPVVGAALQATQTAPRIARQRGLFPELEETASPAALSQLVDRLSSRLGERAVLRVVLRSDPQPEFAYRLVPAVAEAARRRSRSRSPVVIGRPLLLLRRPVPLVVSAATPDGPPKRFSLAGGDYQVAACSEPERIETGWSRRRPIARDYHRVETTAGERFWLFHSLRDDAWFLHGAFG